MTPGDFVAALDGIARGRAEPAAQPWLVLLALCLCRQRARQEWLLEIARGPLAAHGRESGSGVVPGVPGWTFAFHGIGLLLKGPGNELLDVNFHEDDPNAETIDPYFFAHRVAELEPKPAPEEALMRWFIDVDLVVAGLDELRRIGVIHHPQSNHVFRLADPIAALAQSVAHAKLATEALAAVEDSQRPGQGAHRDWLFSMATTPATSMRCVQGACALLDDIEATFLCRLVVEQSSGADAGRALEVAHARTLAVADEAQRLLSGMDPSRDHPYAAWAASQLLLARGRLAALEPMLAFAAVERVHGYLGNPYIAEFATLALEHLPTSALPLVRRALGDSPMNAERMTALLIALDQPWCRRELSEHERRTDSVAEIDAVLVQRIRSALPEEGI